MLGFSTASLIVAFGLLAGSRCPRETRAMHTTHQGRPDCLISVYRNEYSLLSRWMPYDSKHGLNLEVPCFSTTIFAHLRRVGCIYELHLSSRRAHKDIPECTLRWLCSFSSPLWMKSPRYACWFPLNSCENAASHRRYFCNSRSMTVCIERSFQG